MTKTKVCNKCFKERPMKGFHKSSGSKDGHVGSCKRCVQKIKRESDLERKFGLTVKDYEELLESQGRACAVCGRLDDMFGRRLAVDHSHETGEVRGLLCGPCNMAIGLLGDNLRGVRRACRYLEKTEERT